MSSTVTQEHVRAVLAAYPALRPDGFACQLCHPDGYWRAPQETCHGCGNADELAAPESVTTIGLVTALFDTIGKTKAVSRRRATRQLATALAAQLERPVTNGAVIVAGLLSGATCRRECDVVFLGLHEKDVQRAVPAFDPWLRRSRSMAWQSTSHWRAA